MRAIICSAGQGSRLGLGIPKALVEINGKKLIDWQLEALRDYDVTVVCGFKANEVIAAVNGRAKIVVNHDYMTSSTCHSIALCQPGEALILDGDLIFTQKAIEGLPTGDFVGVCNPRTEDAVYTQIVNDNVCVAFTRTRTNYEWACIFRGDPAWFKNIKTGYVYEVLSKRLPMTVGRFPSFEIDTPQDLMEATKWWEKQQIITKFWENRSKDKFLWRDELKQYDLQALENLIIPGSDIIDLGAGDGRLSIHLAEHSKVTAVDFMPVVLEINHPNITSICTDIRSLSIEKKFEVVILFGVTTYCSPKETFELYELCYRLLKPGGVLIAKHQCGRSSDVYIDSEIEGHKYVAYMPFWENEFTNLNKIGFSTQCVDPYPPSIHKYNNTFFRMFICHK